MLMQRHMHLSSAECFLLTQVTMRTIRQVAIRTFEHLHALDLQVSPVPPDRLAQQGHRSRHPRCHLASKADSGLSVLVVTTV